MPIEAAVAVSDFEELGPVIYQEAKNLDDEMHFIAVHDNSKNKYVCFEAYGFESGKVYHIQYDYMNFDAFFR